jgi:organic hydroperoxide reductase OsmC/OhrA
MSEVHTFSSSLQWTRTTASFSYDDYNRSHELMTGSGVSVAATSAPAFRGSASRANPEELLLASLSSCHMLTFLALAAKKRFVIDSYTDDAMAFMEPRADGKLAVTRATLKPKVSFSGERQPTEADVTAMHEKSHANCFIANSVTTVVTIEGSVVLL